MYHFFEICGMINTGRDNYLIYYCIGEVAFMDYKKSILAILDRIEDSHKLEMIYNYLRHWIK